MVWKGEWFNFSYAVLLAPAIVSRYECLAAPRRRCETLLQKKRLNEIQPLQNINLLKSYKAKASFTNIACSCTCLRAKPVAVAALAWRVR